MFDTGPLSGTPGCSSDRTQGLALLFVAVTIDPGKRKANTRYLANYSWDDLAFTRQLLSINPLLPSSTLHLASQSSTLQFKEHEDG